MFVRTAILLILCVCSPLAAGQAAGVADGRPDSGDSGFPDASLTIYFAPGATRFLFDSPAPIADLAARLRREPDLAVSVYGYTPDSGHALRDMAQAQARAKELHRLLLIAGAPPERVRYADPGSYRALVPAATDDQALRAHRAVARVHPEYD